MKRISSESIGLSAELESPQVDMVCPMLASHGGQNNFWKSSCEDKQKLPELVKTCYPHCKYGDQVSKEPMNVSSPYARELAQHIVKLRMDGLTIDQIAQRVCRTPRLVSMRLSTAGLLKSPGKGPTKKEIMMDMLKDNPDMSLSEITSTLGITHKTADSYRREFRRRLASGDI